MPEAEVGEYGKKYISTKWFFLKTNTRLNKECYYSGLKFSLLAIKCNPSQKSAPFYEVWNINSKVCVHACLHM